MYMMAIDWERTNDTCTIHVCTIHLCTIHVCTIHVCTIHVCTIHVCCALIPSDTLCLLPCELFSTWHLLESRE